MTQLLAVKKIVVCIYPFFYSGLYLHLVCHQDVCVGILITYRIILKTKTYLLWLIYNSL